MIALGAALPLVLAASRIGIVSLGPDATAAGRLQVELERRLPGPSIELAGPAFLAPFAAPAREPARAAPSPESAKLFQEAIDAYFEGSIPYALDRLSALAALQQRDPSTPVAERTRLRLWRTAVFRALKDETHAAEEAIAALVAAPDLRVDLGEFPPAVAEIVESQRPLLRMVTVTFGGLPPGARIAIDERVVASPARVAVGTHGVVVSAPGRRDVAFPLDLTRDASLEVPLPYALSPDAEAALVALATTGVVPKEHAAIFAEMAQSGLQGLVITVSRPGETQAALVRLPGGPAERAPPFRGSGAGAEVARFAEIAVQKVLQGTPDAKGPRARVPVDLFPVAGLAVSRHTRTLDGGRRLTMPFSGAGALLGVEAVRRSLIADAVLEWTSFSLSRVEFVLPDDTRRTVTGGSTLAARVSGGYRHDLGRGRSVQGTLGIAHERHAADPVRDGANDDAGLLPSFARTAVVARAGGGLAVGRATALVELGVAPVSVWSESPAGASGRSPQGGVGLHWCAGGQLRSGRSVTTFAVYEGELRSVRFSGSAETAIALDDANVSELVHTIRAGAAWRF